MLEAEGVTQIASKVLTSKIQRDQMQPGKLHQSKGFNRDLRLPKTYSGTEWLHVSFSLTDEGATDGLEIN